MGRAAGRLPRDCGMGEHPCDCYQHDRLGRDLPWREALPSSTTEGRGVTYRDGTRALFDAAYEARAPLFGMTPTDCVREAAEVLKPGARVAELGCGDGRDTMFLLARGMHVTCIDFSSKGMAALKREATQRGLTERLTTNVADVLDIDFGTAVFDAIVGVTILDHLTIEDRNWLLEALCRAVAPGGLMVLEVHTDRDPSTDPAHSATSEFAPAIASVFAPNDLLAPFIDGWRILKYSDRVELDTDHGPKHMHGFATVIASKLRAEE